MVSMVLLLLLLLLEGAHGDGSLSSVFRHPATVPMRCQPGSIITTDVRQLSRSDPVGNVFTVFAIDRSN